jgi:flagellar motility protein MotE (MotC chaperone)
MASAVLLAALLIAAAEPPAAPGPTTPAVPEAKAPATPTEPAGEGERTEHTRVTETDRVDPRAEPLPGRGAVERHGAEVAPGEKTEKAAAEKPASRALTGSTLPPSLTARALLEELRRAAKDRHAEQTSLDEQRQKLETLQREVETSRAALREETRRLQELVAAAATADKKDGKKSKDSALDALAKTARGMKADTAAAMLTKIDRGMAAAVLAKMRPADAAQILDKMDPATGASLFALLAGRDHS